MAKHDFEIGFKLIKDPSQIDQWVNTVANKMAKGMSAAGTSSMDAFKKSMESGFSYIFKDFEKHFSSAVQNKVGNMVNNPLVSSHSQTYCTERHHIAASGNTS